MGEAAGRLPEDLKDQRVYPRPEDRLREWFEKLDRLWVLNTAQFLDDRIAFIDQLLQLA